MKRFSLALAAVFALATVSFSPAADAQITATVVSVCGTPPGTYTAGQPRPVTQDTTGKLCDQGSAGGGGAVTIAAGADVTEGNITDAAWSGTGNGTLDAILKAIALQALSATPSLVNLTQVNSTTLLTGTGAQGAGSPRVTVAIDSATVAGSPSLPAGTALIGKTGIDQTTPGTTNRVAIADTNNTLPDYTATSPTGQVGPYPGKNTAGVYSSATPETCSSGNIANATVACTLATASAKTTYISGFAMTADGATVGLAVSCTLTGTITGTMTFTFSYPAGAVVAGVPLIVQFSPAVPASTTNTTIVASCPASGTGGTNATMNAWGFLL